MQSLEEVDTGDPDLLAMYVTRRADDGVAVSTLRVDLAAIRTAHRLTGIPLDLNDPWLAMVVEGITRRLGTRPQRQAAAVLPDVLRRLLAACRHRARRSARGTAPCCCWALALPCAARN